MSHPDPPTSDPRAEITASARLLGHRPVYCLAEPTDQPRRAVAASRRIFVDVNDAVVAAESYGRTLTRTQYIIDQADRRELTGDPQPTDPRQSLRSVELLLPRSFYDRLEALRATHAPALTLPDFLAKLLVPGADGFEAAMGDIDRASRLVISP